MLETFWILKNLQTQKKKKKKNNIFLSSNIQELYSYKKKKKIKLAEKFSLKTFISMLFFL
jgi:hypothetical protein